MDIIPIKQKQINRSISTLTSQTICLICKKTWTEDVKAKMDR